MDVSPNPLANLNMPIKISWFSSLFFFHAKQNNAPSFLIRVAKSLTLILRGLFSFSIKDSLPPTRHKTCILNINDFPNELILELFPHLPLKSLIAAQGVCQRWRQLVSCSDLLPARRNLLQFYLRVVHSPHFELTRPWVLANLQSFDRQAFVEDLIAQHHYLPETFRLWILEWPARAVVGCVWPGLPDVKCRLRAFVGVERIKGSNWLARMPATVSTIKLRQEANIELVPGICIWSSGDGYVWLMLDERESLRDKVFSMEERDRLRGEEGDEFDEIYTGWLEWLEERWKEVEEACRELTEKNHDYYYCDADRAGEYLRPGPPEIDERPGDSWSRRDEPL